MRNIPDADTVARTARFDQELAHLKEVLPIHLEEEAAADALEQLRDDQEATHSIAFSLTECVPHRYWPTFLEGVAAALRNPGKVTPIWAGMCAVADYRARETRFRKDTDRER